MQGGLRHAPGACAAVMVATPMSEVLKPEGGSRLASVAFELDRFELGKGDRCNVRGRWFGVRGRRFMRPTLTLTGDGHRSRLLADLEHKPWNAEEGELWEVVFEGEIADADLTEVELTVAPDITIALPLVRAGRNKAQKRTASKPRQAGHEAQTRQLSAAETELRRLRRRLAAAESEKTRGEGRVTALAAELDQTAEARDQAQRERDEAAAQRDTAAEQHDKAAAERDEAAAQRDEAAAERRAALAAREEAQQAHVTAMTEADAARRRLSAERDEAVAARDGARSERDAALTERDRAVSEREAALAERDEVRSERDAALTACDQMASERDAANKVTERLKSELAEVKASHGAALVMRRATQAQPRTGYGGSHSVALATIALLVIAAIVLLALGII